MTLPAIATILALVSEETGITVAELKSPIKSRPVARPRQLAYWLCRRVALQPYKTIGREIGNRDHTTIMHGFYTAERLRQTSPAFRALSDRCMERALGRRGNEETVGVEGDICT